MIDSQSFTRRQTLFPALIRTGLAVGISDAFFASSLAVLVPPYATILRLWQGVASVPFGKGMIGGGLPAALLGLVTHFGVAFFGRACSFSHFALHPHCVMLSTAGRAQS